LNRSNAWQLRAFSGFTLIEIMIVVFIVGILASGVAMLATRDQAVKVINDEAQTLQRGIAYLQNQAMNQHRYFGLAFSELGWQLLTIEPTVDFVDWGAEPGLMPAQVNSNSRQQSAEEQKSPWGLIELDKARHTLSPKLEISLIFGEDEPVILESDFKKVKAPQILLSAQGEVSPFSIRFAAADGSNEQLYSIDGNGRLTRVNTDD